MFGKNKLVPPTYTRAGRSSEAETKGEKLTVKSIFYTIQGEGPFIGMPAVFVRLAGCNLACTFCDTDFEDGELMTVDAILEQVEQCKINTSLIVLTGGEPMRQQILPLCFSAINRGYKIQIETAGTCCPPAIADGSANGMGLPSLMGNGQLTIVCSPKTATVHRIVETFCSHYKYIVRAQENTGRGDPAIDKRGLPFFSTQNNAAKDTVALFRPASPRATIWLQPCAEYLENGEPDNDSTRLNIDLVTHLSLVHGYRVSFQLHKILGVE